MNCFRNDRGKVFARLGDEVVLRKSEWQRDRLRVTGGRSHALEETLLDEVIGAGGKALEITEKGISGEVRIFRIPLEDIRRYGKRLTLGGVSRWTIPLAACELVKGSKEEWWTIDRTKFLEVEKLRAAVPKKRSRSRQKLLFLESGVADLPLSYEI